MLRLIVSILVITFAPSALGYPFEVQPTDISLKGLGSLFGSSVGAVYLGGQPNPLISDMFELFNSIVLSIGGIFVGYLTLISVINTAQQGEILGRTWSSVYIPLRSVLGLLLLIPTPGTGFAMIQVTAMYLIVQGIGAANLLWNVVMEGLASGVSATDFQKPNTSKLKQDSGDITRDILSAAVCMESIKYLSNTTSTASNLPADFPLTNSDFITSGAGTGLRPWLENGGQSASSTADDVTYFGSINYGTKNNPTYSNFCGAHKILGNARRSEWPSSMQGSANVDSKARDLFEKKVSTMLAMYSNVLPIAKRIVQNKIEPRDLNDRLADTQPRPGGFIPTVKDIYVDTLAGAIVPKEPGGVEQQVSEQGMLYGWASAGTFYFLLNASSSQKLFRTIKNQPPQVSPTPDLRGSIPSAATAQSMQILEDYLTPSEFTFVKNRLKDALNYYENDKVGAEASLELTMLDSAGGGFHKFIKALMTPLTKMTEAIVSDFMGYITGGGGGDPLLSMAQFGSSLMITAEVFWIVLIGISIVLAVVAGICSAASPAFVTVLNLVLTMISVIFALFIALWCLGATMAVYLPLIPYMLFFIGLIGWFFQVVEAIVAMPLVGLAVITPTGDEVGRITPALMLLLSTILRPSLMIMGFIIAAIVLRAMISFINYTFIPTWEGGPSTGSLFMPIVVIGLYIGLVVAMVNNIFKLIYILPDKVMRWIEGGSVATGRTKGEEILKEAEKGAEAGMEVGKGVLAGGMEAMEQAQSKMEKAKDKAKAKKKMKQYGKRKTEIEDQLQQMQDSMDSGKPTDDSSGTSTNSGSTDGPTGDGGGGTGGGGTGGGTSGSG